MNTIFAVTTYGLEAICVAECIDQGSLTEVESSYRCVSADIATLSPDLLNLKTVDDAFLQLVFCSDCVHTREMLARLKQIAAEIDLPSALSTLQGIRQISALPSFSISASFIGKRNYSSSDIKQVLSQSVAAATNWLYQEDDRLAEINIRVFIVHEHLRIGIRLGRTALHERSYRKAERPGALKAPVAAAMVRLAGLSPHESVLDPCCGSGTILAESALAGFTVTGGDIDHAAVSAAKENISALTNPNVEQWDARALPIRPTSVNCIISNLPWGKQILPGSDISKLYSQLYMEFERILVPGGRAILLTTPLVSSVPSSLTLISRTAISLYGERPEILCYTRR